MKQSKQDWIETLAVVDSKCKTIINFLKKLTPYKKRGEEKGRSMYVYIYVLAVWTIIRKSQKTWIDPRFQNLNLSIVATIRSV